MTVPTLPDSERRTRYTGVSSSTGPFDVGFDLYGNGTDYQNWIEVWDDGVKLTGVTDWTMDSPTVSIATATERPITDARITFTTARSGTIDIVGADRPRRTVQLTEGTGESAANKNRTYTQLVARLREMWDKFSRAVLAPPGETMNVLSAAATRASRYAKFDASGHLTHGETVTTIEGGATDAAASAAAAAASASSASTSATNASNSASAASTSASNASTSATAAASSATAAAAAAAALAFKYTWESDTAASDPGSGKVSVNNAAPASATALYISETDANSNGIASEIARWDDATNASGKARVKIAKDATNFLLLTITSAETDNGAWKSFTVSGGMLVGSLADGDTVYITVDTSGSDGSGTISGTVGTTDNAFPRADGVGGTTLQGGRTTESDAGKVTVNYEDATTNTVVHGLKVTRTSSGTPAAGIGTGIELEVETAAGNNEVGATIEAVTSDVTSTSEDFDLVLKTMAAGATAAERLRVLSTGEIRRSSGGFDRFAEIAAPSTPASGNVHLYAKTDGRLYEKDDAGTERGLSSVGKQPIWIPAGACKARATSGAGSSTYDSGSNDITIATFDFDTSSQEYIHTCPIAMPKAWNESTVTAVIHWTNTGGASTQTVRWTVAGLAVSDDDTLNGTFGTAVNIDDTWLAQNDEHKTSESGAITIGGSPAEGDLVIFQISRDVANDNMAGDANFIGITLYITTNAPTDD